MGARHRGREAALQMLYQADQSGDLIEQVLQSFLGLLDGSQTEIALDPVARDFAERLARGVARERDRLDDLIRAGSAHWRIERMAVVDRNVLRLALFELLDEPDTPAAVILDEAVELAKIFGGEESGAFVNGVLDGIRRRLEEGSLIRG
ncbi:MAG: transcription antitermination factor NusB [Acidobacteriota bacterium]|nr:MAG: transcription antitermination factor NusB [Acidobacteriota bacterium]